MSLTRKACKNHPDKKTARRCYHCRDYICTDCQKTIFHHIFCSVSCALKWRGKALLKGSLPSRDLIWFTAIVIVVNVVMYQWLAPDYPPGERPVNAANDSSLVYPAPGNFAVDSLRQAVRGRLQLRIEAEEGMALALSHQGHLRQSGVVKNGQWQFEDVALESGENQILIWGLRPDGSSVLVDSFVISYSSPRLDYLTRPVYSAPATGKKLALTFDGGSSKRGAQEILDILRKNNLQSTMFLTGGFIERYPGLVRQMLDDGHEIANHSWNHPHFTNLEIDGSNRTRDNVNRAYLQRQLRMTDSVYVKLTGQRMAPYWRAPFGEINNEILYWAAELGYRHIGWSARCDSWDWVEDTSSTLYRSAAEIRDHFLDLEEKRGLQGNIILMHLGSERENDFPYETLDELIGELQSRGYRLVKVSELLRGSVLSYRR